MVTRIESLDFELGMLHDAIEFNEANPDADTPALLAYQREQVARLTAERAAMIEAGVANERDAFSVAVPERKNILDRPAGGSKAGNQYGTFRVHPATERQHRFMLNLIRTRDIAKLADHTTMPLDPAKVRAQVTAGVVNKKAASDLIDRLLQCPELPGATRGIPASDKQLGLIRRLANERQLSDDDRAKVLAAVDGKTLSTKGASATIDKLFKLPKAARPASAPADLAAGMYVNDATGVLLRVYLGQNSGQLLCKKVVGSEAEGYELEYQGRADRFVTKDFRRMGLEEAKVWGKATGHCCVCARRLDVPESVDAGIGPKCAGRV